MHFMPCAALALVYTLITLTFLWQSLPGGSITGLTIGKYLHRQLQMEVHGKQRLVSGDQFAKCDFRGVCVHLQIFLQMRYNGAIYEPWTRKVPNR